jgi:hypothetical protein
VRCRQLRKYSPAVAGRLSGRAGRPVTAITSHSVLCSLIICSISLTVANCILVKPEGAQKFALLSRQPHTRTMRRILLQLSLITLFAAGLYAGAETYSSKNTAAAESCPNWYSEHEWNLSLWGTYAFTSNNYPTLQNSAPTFGTPIMIPTLRRITLGAVASRASIFSRATSESESKDMRWPSNRVFQMRT